MTQITQPAFYTGATFPASGWTPVTPSNSVNLSFVPQALYIGVAGDISLTDADGNTVVFTVAAGILDLSPVRVNATGTTATNIVALYQSLR